MTRTSLFFDSAAVRLAAESSGTQSEAMRKLRQIPHADNFRRFREACDRYGVAYPTRAMSRRPSGAFTDDDRVRSAVARSSSLGGALLLMGLSRGGTNIVRLKEAMVRTGVTLAPASLPEHLAARDSRWREVQSLDRLVVASLATESRSQLELLRRLGVGRSAPDYRLLAALLEDHDIPLPPSLASKGFIGMSNEDYFREGEKRNSRPMKDRIIRGDLIPHAECEACEQGRLWNGQPLELHLDHVNGDHHDNRLSNLRFLCPNCHSQTDTYCKPIHLRSAR